MTMSSSRKRKSFQIVESKWWLCSSRVLRGHAGVASDMGSPPSAVLRRAVSIARGNGGSNPHDVSPEASVRKFDHSSRRGVTHGGALGETGDPSANLRSLVDQVAEADQREGRDERRIADVGERVIADQPVAPPRGGTRGRRGGSRRRRGRARRTDRRREPRVRSAAPSTPSTAEPGSRRSTA